IRSVERIDEPFEAWVHTHAPDVNLGDRLLSPAFINAHTHVALSFMRGVSAHEAGAGNMVEDLFFHMESRLAPEDTAAFARLGAYECLLNGQAIVWDHYYHAEAIADAVADVGLSIVMAPTLQDLDGPGKNVWAESLAETERLANRRGARGVWAAVGPHATDTVSAALWAKAGALADRCRLPLHFHLAQSIEEYRRIEAAHGLSPVQWLVDIGALADDRTALMAHGLFVSRADLERLDSRRHALAYCPGSQVVFGFEARMDRWRQAGFRIAVGTDTAASNDSMNVQKELRWVAAGAKGVPFSDAFERFFEDGGRASADALAACRAEAFAASEGFTTPAAVLDTVWSAPGRLHAGFKAGVIEAGAEAHLAAWNLKHPSFWPARDVLAGLAFADTTGALDGLWVGGRCIGQVGRFATSIVESAAYADAWQEATDRWHRLVAR
ncbi:MAG: amidohydrolase family protein, partial [Myxococcota bacterium]